MPVKTYGITCIDSRVMRTIMYGLPLGHGGFLRIPAGDLSEITPAEGGDVVLISDSAFAESLANAFEKEDIIAQLLDSHYECAAQKLDMEDSLGEAPADNGLYQDVVTKKKTAKALISHVDRNHLGKRILPIQTTFDIRDGFMYMGLERDEALGVGKANGDTFTQRILDQLVEEKRIIHTKELLRDAKVGQLFEGHRIDNFDWEKNYKHTITSFWKNMEDMIINGELLTPIKTQVKELYQNCSEEELNERATLLALNAYNAYQLGRIRKYPHDTHRETVVVASEGENGPYAQTSSFSVNSGAQYTYDTNMRLAVKIIRHNRREERIVDTTGQYHNKNDFVKAPVPIAHKVTLRSENVDWDMVNRIVGLSNFVPSNWPEMSSEDFKKHIKKNIMSNMPVNLLDALDDLRQEMTMVYAPQGKLDERIMQGQIEVVPVIVDSNREIRAIVPFVYKGYPQSVN